MADFSFSEDLQNLGSKINKTANITVKKLHSLKRFVRKTVVISHNYNSKNQKGDITCQHID